MEASKKMLSVITYGIWSGTVTVEENGKDRLRQENSNDKNFTLNQYFDEKEKAVKIKIGGIKTNDMSVEIVVKDLLGNVALKTADEDTNKKIVELEKRIADHSAQIINNGIEIQNVRSHTMFNDSLTSSRIKGIENRSDTALFIGVAAMIMSIVCAVLQV